MPPTAAPPVMALVSGVSEYHGRVLRGMTRALRRHRTPLLVVANEPFADDRTPDLVLDLIRRRVPVGVVALGDTAQFPRPEVPEALLESGIPTVTFTKRLATMPRVVGDNSGGMRELLRHLLDDRGVRRVVLVRGIPGHVDATQREAAFREEMARHGVPVDEDLVVDGHFRAFESYDVLHRLLARRRDFEAVVALNDMSAFGALSALTDHSLRVPQDMLLTGFDNSEGSVTTWPPLTTVDQNLEEQGALAIDLVLRLADGLPCPSDVLVPSRLVLRASTDPRGAAADPQVQEATMRALQNQVALQDAAAYVSSSLANCRTVTQILEAVEPRLSRLGVRRCFLAISADAPRDGGRVMSPDDEPRRLVFSYRDGAAEPASEEVFPRHELLPPSLRDELCRGVLLLQALSIDGRERGYVLFEPVQHSYLLTEALRVDLPRSIDIVLSWQEMRDHSATLEHLVACRTRELEQANAELRRSVMRDGLTGVANRLAFQQYLEEFGAADGGEGRHLSVLMIDVDLFKAFNDRYGHLAGDDALRSVASCLVSAVRQPGDLACRYGGEEFAVVLGDAPARAAMAVAKRFRRLLADVAIPHEASEVAPVVTVSIGAASGVIGADVRITDVLAAADEALYRAKSQGRDRTILAGACRDLPRRPALHEPAGGAARTAV